MAAVTHINLAEKKVTADSQTLSYDYLILACGATHSYFGHHQWQPFAPGLKTIEQATEIRRRILMAFEKAECEHDPLVQKDWLTFVIVGGGPTGVELAGALGEIARLTLSRDFHRIDPRRTRIILIEAGPRILAQFAEDLSQRATEDLEQLGVTVWTSTRVTDIRAEGVALGSEFIAARTVLWAAGVKPNPLNKLLASPLDAQGRVLVNRFTQLENHPEVYVIGDQAAFLAKDGKPLPGVAPVAMQQGRHVAKNILRNLKSKPYLPFHYMDKGQLATIGRRRAVVETAYYKMTGWRRGLSGLVFIFFI